MEIILIIAVVIVVTLFYLCAGREKGIVIDVQRENMRNLFGDNTK